MKVEWKASIGGYVCRWWLHHRNPLRQVDDKIHNYLTDLEWFSMAIGKLDGDAESEVVLMALHWGKVKRAMNFSAMTLRWMLSASRSLTCFLISSINLSKALTTRLPNQRCSPFPHQQGQWTYFEKKHLLGKVQVTYNWGIFSALVNCGRKVLQMSDM